VKESEVIRAILQTFPDSGIGDDTATLEIDGKVFCFSCDASVEGVHFRREYSTLRQIVEKLITSNVSDIYASGCRPLDFLLTAGLPAGFSQKDLQEVLGGLKSACEYYSIRVIGGDTVLSPGRLFFNVSIRGVPEGGRIIHRKGARPGDRIAVYGGFGCSIVGLYILEYLFSVDGAGERAGKVLSDRVLDFIDANRDRLKEIAGKIDIGDEWIDEEKEGRVEALVVSCMRQHLVPVAHPLPGELLLQHAGYLRAGIDISDGLAIDLSRVCQSSGLSAMVYEEKLVAISPIQKMLKPSSDVVRFLVSSGEEYSLVLAVDPDITGDIAQFASIIGEFVEGAGEISLVKSDGKAIPLDTAGYEHTF